MSDISSLLDNAEIDVSSTVNFNFNWGTIGIIVGSVVALVIIIIIIVYVCGRGGVNCCDTGMACSKSNEFFFVSRQLVISIFEHVVLKYVARERVDRRQRLEKRKSMSVHYSYLMQ